MGSFTGTGADDTITGALVSPGVTRNSPTPPNARPSAENDFVSGGQGHDLIAGMAGNDDLRGDDGNDTIDGGGDNDFLNGGAGNDVLIGGSGNDNLTGGDGIDIYQFGRNWGADFLNPSATTGRDIIQFLDNVDRTKVQFRVENDDLIIFQGANSIFINNQFFNGVGNSTPVREVQFANGPAVDISRPLDAWLNRTGTQGNDTSLVGSIFKDTIDGRAGNDRIFGVAGNDVLTGGKGNDYMEGGLDNDLYRFDKGFGIDTLFEWASQGRDTIEFGGGIKLADLSFFVQGGSLIVRQGQNQITLTDQFSSGQNANARFETIVAGANTLDIRKVNSNWLARTGKNTDERFDGSIFNDTLDGAGGNDRLFGVAGNDVLTGGKGNDYMEGGLGNDRYVFQTGFGVDTIFESAGAGNDRIVFGSGIAANSLNFHIDGTTLFITLGGASIRVESQFFNGTGNNARVESIEFNNGNTLSLKKPEADWLVRSGTNGNEFFGGSNFGDTIDGRGGNDNINGGLGRDSLEGGAGNDTLTGGEDNDTLSGSAGNDSLRADNGNDSLKGGAGLDTLNGGAGRDTLEGGAGNDQLTGGTERDLFVFRQGDGIDFITDFARQDQMQFIGFGTQFNTPQKLLDAAIQAGDDVIIQLNVQGNPQVRVTLLDFNLDRLDVDNFLT